MLIFNTNNITNSNNIINSNKVNFNIITSYKYYILIIIIFLVT